MNNKAYKGKIMVVILGLITFIVFLSGYLTTFAVNTNQGFGDTLSDVSSQPRQTYLVSQSDNQAIGTFKIKIKGTITSGGGKLQLGFLRVSDNKSCTYETNNTGLPQGSYDNFYTFTASKMFFVYVNGLSCPTIANFETLNLYNVFGSGSIRISITPSNFSGQVLYVYGANFDAYFNGIYMNSTGNDTKISDMYWIFQNGFTPTPANISITQPANLSTATTSPAYNSTGVYNIGDMIGYIFNPLIDLNLSYHDTSTGQDLYTTLDAYNFYTSTTTASSTNWSRSLPLNLSNATIASSTFYRLTAKIISSPSNVVVASSTSIFYVNIAGSQLPQPYVHIGGSGTIVSTTTGQILNGCNSNDINILQSVLCWIFIPRIETISQFGGLKTQIINKPPIGYLSAISDIITATTSTSTPIDDLIIPTGSASPFTILRTALTWLLWFIFGIFIFNRLRYLDLW
jgi:hypothetical protein